MKRWLLLVAVAGSCTDEVVEGTQPGACSDGADNDADGLFDCDDPSCAGAPDCATTAPGTTPTTSDTSDTGKTGTTPTGTTPTGTTPTGTTGTTGTGGTPTGTTVPTYDVCSAGAPYTTIQDAIDDAVDGDTIEVCAGTYDPITLSGVDVTLVGVDGAGVTTIRSLSGAAVEVTAGDVTLQSFTIRTLVASGAFGYHQTGGTVLLLDDIFSSNAGDGAASVTGGVVRVDGCTVSSNNGASGIGFQVTNVAAQSWIRHSTFSTNSRPIVLQVSNSAVEIANNVFVGNVATGAVVTTTGGCSVHNNVFYDNTAGPSLVSVNGTQLSANIFQENSVTGSGLVGASGLSSLVSYNNEWSNGKSLTDGTGQLDIDCKLVDPANGDFHLDLSLSPCQDAGLPFEVWNDPDGSLNQIGAYGGPYGAW